MQDAEGGRTESPRHPTSLPSLPNIDVSSTVEAVLVDGEGKRAVVQQKGRIPKGAKIKGGK